MKRPRGGSTLKQLAYAKKLFNADGPSKKDIALSVGYSPSVANNVQVNIEETEGFHNAMKKLAIDSNNLLLEVMSEYKARGLSEFSNKDLNGAMNAIAAGWDRINKSQNPGKNKDPEQNPLRKVFMQRVENQTIINNPAQAVIAEESATASSPEEDNPVKDIDMDF